MSYSKNRESRENSRFAQTFFYCPAQGSKLLKLQTNAVALRRRLWPPTAPSEMDDDAGRADDGVAPVGGDAQIRIAVEGESIERSVIGDLGPNLDLRRGPVLVADSGLDVARPGAGAPTTRPPEKLFSSWCPKLLLQFRSSASAAGGAYLSQGCTTD
jgi:hypothetical protein